jgi:Na+/melibiose symporter-like transporter
MNHTPIFVPITFAVLMVLVLIWFAMIIALFKKLKLRHPGKYSEMGEPSLFWNNSLKTNWKTLKYLFKREHKDLNDNSLSLLSDSMLVFLVIYVILFFGLIFGVLATVMLRMPTAKP